MDEKIKAGQEYMNGKEKILKSIISSLESEEFEYEIFTNYSFDIFAESMDKEMRLVIKALYNIDALLDNHAHDMKFLSLLSNALPVIVGICGRNYILREGIGYVKDGMYAFTPHTFHSFIKSREIESLSKKGKEVVEVDVSIIKHIRTKYNLSLSQFASTINVSKKTAYLLEKRGRGEREVVERIENTWDIKIKASTYKTMLSSIRTEESKEGVLRRAPYDRVIIQNDKKIGENVFVKRNNIKKEEREINDAIRLNNIMEDPHIFIALTPLSVKILKKHGKDYITK